MAGDGRTTHADLTATLLSRGWEFDFTQAVLLLERLDREAVRIGDRGPYSRERIRFAPSQKLAPTASQIQRIEEIGANQLQMTISFFGLYGMAAPGPPYIFEACAGDDDEAAKLRDFLDIFNNRAIALYYRAWRKYRWPVQFRGDGRDPLTRRFFSFVGLGISGRAHGEQKLLADRSSLEAIFPRTRLLRYAGLFSQRNRCPANLRGMIWDYFNGPDQRRYEFVDVEEHVPCWYDIDEAQLPRLGEGHTSLCGQRSGDFVLGRRIRTCMAKFRITLGPLDFNRFCQFLPTGSWHTELLTLVDLYRPDHLDFDIMLRLRADQVPRMKLGTNRLGWSTWLQRSNARRERDGLVVLRRRDVDDVLHLVGSLQNTEGRGKRTNEIG